MYSFLNVMLLNQVIENWVSCNLHKSAFHFCSLCHSIKTRLNLRLQRFLLKVYLIIVRGKLYFSFKVAKTYGVKARSE